MASPLHGLAAAIKSRSGAVHIVLTVSLCTSSSSPPLILQNFGDGQVVGLGTGRRRLRNVLRMFVATSSSLAAGSSTKEEIVISFGDEDQPPPQQSAMWGAVYAVTNDEYEQQMEVIAPSSMLTARRHHQRRSSMSNRSPRPSLLSPTQPWRPNRTPHEGGAPLSATLTRQGGASLGA